VAPPRPDTNVSIFPYDLDQPTVFQWNLSVQHDLPWQTVLSLSYVGTRGQHLPQFQGGDSDANAPVPEFVNGRKFFPEGAPRANPAFQNMNLISFNGDSHYHGLQIVGRRRFSSGLQFQSSYSFGKAIDSASGLWRAGWAGQRNPVDILDSGSEKGPSAFDVRHSFTANFIYALPRSSAAPGWVRTLINNWQINGIVYLSTGFPFQVEVDGTPDRDRDRASRNTRPDLVSGTSANPILGDPKQWFDPRSFALPEPGFYGNLGRNTLRADGFADVDFGLKRSFPISEVFRLDLRIETFNLFNHANFAIPAVRTIFVANNPEPLADSGRVSATANPARQVQFGLKLIW
jgi:hypothetical protein